MLIFTVFKTILSIVFLLLGLLHFYWLFGGKWGFASSIPMKTNSEYLFKPRIWETTLVGIGLLFFGLFFWFRIDAQIELHYLVNDYLGWVIAGIFFLRAVGDFNYLGVFKRIKNTDFAKKDTHVYVPLCLMIFTMIAIVELLIGF